MALGSKTPKKRTASKPPTPVSTDAPHEALFDYFYREVFEKADPQTQRLLWRTAYLPMVSPSAAEELTEDARAGEILSRLHRNAPSKLVLSVLRESSLAIAKAGGSLRPPLPERAVEEWKGLIAARWKLLDVCESDGCKYLVAQQNQPAARPTSLTNREKQVVALAVQGQPNKLIAHTLGISHATVRVLTARAARKLRAATREEMIRCYASYANAAELAT